MSFIRMSRKWFKEHFLYDLFGDYSKIDCPVLAVTGKKDFQADYKGLETLTQYITSPLETYAIENMNHGLKEQNTDVSILEVKKLYLNDIDKELHKEFKDVLANWLSKYFQEENQGISSVTFPQQSSLEEKLVKLFDKFFQQFHMPQGLLGRFAGFLMANDAKKSEWTISLIEPNKNDHVLEIGFGPGVAIETLSEIVTNGYIAGIDISETMLKQAKKRNEEAIQKGLVDLRLASVSELPIFEEKFDHIMSVNSIIFWENPVSALTSIRQIMKPNGKIAITLQPRMKGANNETVKEFGQKINHYLTEAGYSECKIYIKSMKPIAAVCVTAINK